MKIWQWIKAWINQGNSSSELIGVWYFKIRLLNIIRFFDMWIVTKAAMTYGGPFPKFPWKATILTIFLISNRLQIWNKIIPKIPWTPNPKTRGINFSFPIPEEWQFSPRNENCQGIGISVDYVDLWKKINKIVNPFLENFKPHTAGILSWLY